MALFLSSFILVSLSDDFNFKYIPTISEVKAFFDNSNGSDSSVKGDCEVHFIDVGQGDSTLIISNGKTILIDAGENDKGKVVIDYLKKLKINKIDLLVATHPHSDHIGGMDTVIKEFEIEKIVMPKLSDSLVPTTRTYTDMLSEIAAKGLKITPSKPGLEYTLGDGTLSIIGPNSEFNDLNDTSIVAKFVYGDYSFMFTGDMEKPSEKDLLNSKAEIKSDVLKVAHHGSSTSTHKAFYQAVDPDYCIISVGDGNKYNHPSKSTLTTIALNGAKYYRTDYSGSVVFKIADGKLDIKTEK